jgi:hypothetical protein
MFCSQLEETALPHFKSISARADAAVESRRHKKKDATNYNVFPLIAGSAMLCHQWTHVKGDEPVTHMTKVARETNRMETPLYFRTKNKAIETEKQKRNVCPSPVRCRLH